MNRALFAVFSFFGVAVLLTAGCSKPALDPAVVAQHRTKLTLAEEPDGAQTVLDVRNAMFGVTETEEHAHEDAGDDAEAADAAAPGAAEADSGEAAEQEGEHADHEHEDAAHDHDEADHEHADADHEHADEHAHDDHDHDHADHDHAHAGELPKTPVIPEMDVVMVGSVGGIANPSEQTHPEFPFAKSQAVFFLADPEVVAEMDEHAHVHADGEECAFCAAHAADAAHLLAVVQFKGEDGKPLRVDARDLFDLKEKETVVVRGKASIGAGGMLTVDATGLYVRR